MLSRPPATRFALLTLALLVAALPACSKAAPPAPVPEPPPPAPEPVPVAPEPAVEPLAADEWEEAPPVPQTFLTIEEINSQRLLKRVHFDFDRAEIRADQRASLQENAVWLRDHADVRILLEGHCDERGTREYNLSLGDRRAQATRDYLVSLGIAAERVETVSYGEERPRASGSNEEAWAQNRRAEFVAVAAGPTDS